MSGDDRPKRIKRKYLFPAVLFVASAAIITLLILLIYGHVSGSQRIGLFSPRRPAITVNEFNFDVGRGRVLAHANGSIAAVGTLGIQVLDTGGRETLRDSFRMNRPAVSNTGDRFIVFDIGGTTVRVFESSQVSTFVETDGSVVSASINQNGWFCIVTQESGGFRGTITVYNNNGSRVYEDNLGRGYALSAELSPDNKTLAILNLIDTGSRVTFYSIDTEDDPDHIFDLPGGLIIDIMYLPNGEVLTVSTDLLFIIDSSGEGRSLYPFPEKRLGSYTNNGNFVALHLYDYGLGHRGRLVTLLTDGTVLGELEIERDVASLSSVGNSLVVLKYDGVSFYSDELEEFPVIADSFSAAGATQVLAVYEDTAIAASDNSAVVIRREEER